MDKARGQGGGAFIIPRMRLPRPYHDMRVMGRSFMVGDAEVPQISYALTVALVILLFCFAFPAPVHADGFPIIGVLHVGTHPEAIAVDTQTHLVYIGYEGDGLILGFNPSTGNVQWRTKIGDVTTDVQVDSSKHWVYVASFSFQSNQSILSVLDGSNGKTLLSLVQPTNNGFGDSALTVDTKRQQVYLSNDQAGVVNVFTLVTASGTGTLSAQPSVIQVGPHPQALGVNSRLGRLYVGDTTTHTITVLDENTGREVATIAVADRPVPPLRVDEATGRVYVVSSLGQELDVIDGNTNSVIAHIPVTSYPEGVAFNTATGRIYVAGEGNKDNNADQDDRGRTITVIDGQTFAVLGTFQVGEGPDGVESDPGLRRVYVAVEDSNAVVEISDSVDLPLHTDSTVQQVGAVHQALSVLQAATVITLIVMVLTLLGAALGTVSTRRKSSM